MRQLGIDEAGRGPVIGPMVIAGVVLDKNGERQLKDAGVKDSKMLSIEKRKSLIELIKEVSVSNKIMILEPKEIDEALDSINSNLNRLEMLNMAMIANSLDSEEIVIDAPTSNIDSFRNELRVYLKKKDRKIILEHKADINFVSVAAASILAKVTRDWEIEKIKIKYGIEIGSGYPSDPKTREFLAENYNKYDFFRKSWSSWKRLVQKTDNKQSKLDGW
ncbi:MAG: ribonuclease HII [Candidatus Woesearchaeota archaeon]